MRRRIPKKQLPKRQLVRPLACKSPAVEEEYDPCNPLFTCNTYKIPMLNMSEISRLLLEIAPHLPHSEAQMIPDQYPPLQAYPPLEPYLPDKHQVSLPRDPRNRRHSFLNHVL